jgi:DNA primase
MVENKTKMAKISPVSIKYMIHANFTAEGALEKPDVIGAIFGQTEGLLGAELEMRELQKEGKIGRIEVDLDRRDKMTTGKIKIPTALDQSETTLIAAAIETIERIGPSDSQIEVEKIEDVRGSKRDYILERAKKLMSEIKGSTDSREISNEIKDSAKTANIQEYGEEKLPAGNISGKEIIVVEGRADVVNLLRAGVNNVIAMNGTKLPNAIKELAKEKEITLFVDGDRGGKLIVQNVTDNASIDYIVVAPDGKEVEELAGKEILMILRRKTPLNEFLKREGMQRREDNENQSTSKRKELSEEQKEKLKKILRETQDSGKAILLDESLREIREISARGFGGSLRRVNEKPYAIVLDGTVTSSVIESAEDAGCQVIVARSFAATSENVQLLSF